jgi:signal transduction histidine kinase
MNKTHGSHDAGSLKLRPSGKHIFTVGRDLVGDNYAAIIELIKNSYDADARSVEITFSKTDADETSEEKNKKEHGIKITVKDDGHGMDFNTVRDIWMVPSFSLKKEQKDSPEGRLLQGRKGIGRFASSRLGNELFLKTVDKAGEKTSMLLDWKKFADARFLDEVEILTDHSQTSEPHGTELKITGGKEFLDDWNANKIKKLISELRLIVPTGDSDDSFSISLIFKDFDEIYPEKTVKIEPLPLLDMYNYRLHGEIKRKEENADITVMDLTYKNLYENTEDRIYREIKFPDEKRGLTGKFPSSLEIDFRIFDRDRETLIEIGEKFKEERLTDIKKKLDEITGISIYRKDFRLRPYGNPGYDWLELDRRRVNNPGLRIGNNQIAGIIKIMSEEESNLEEKSARDGLKENEYFEGLKNLSLYALKFMEENRYQYRLRTGRGRKREHSIEKELESLFDFSEIENKISQSLKKKGITDESLNDDIRLILEEQRKIKQDTIDSVEKTVAVYRGQITLGKIMMVIQHEIRIPLGVIKNLIPVVLDKFLLIKKNPAAEILAETENILNAIHRNSKNLIDLVNKLNILAVTRRVRNKINLCDVIKESARIFENEFKRSGIEFKLECSIKNMEISAVESEISQIFVNLIDNSLYWLGTVEKTGKMISINASVLKNETTVKYNDTGPGIQKKYIENGIIFEPGFSTKTDGTGLGLAIAGEIASKNGGKLEAVYSESGAVFVLKFNEKQ